mgnify:CR=1 FL=1|jgi:hypothetical protein
MRLVRTILAIFISAGMALAPVQAANAMRMMSMASMVDSAEQPADEDCSCCNVAARCPMVVCATHCVQYAPSSGATFGVTVLGHATLRGFVPSLHDGLNWQPPTPPPRA